LGIRVDERSTVTARNCDASGNLAQGYLNVASGGTAAVLNLEGCLAASNAAHGVRSFGGLSTIRISNCTVANNGTGLSVASSGAIISFAPASNRVVGNGASDSPTSVVPQQ
jgi:hypothetical protein